MKNVFSLLVVSVALIGCSKPATNSAPATPSPVATDLGKTTKYFSDLYGHPVVEKRLSAFDFALPSEGHLVRLETDFLSQYFTNGNLIISVLYSGSATQAVWVKYTMKSAWTDAQLSAALGAYDSKWQAINIQSGVSQLGEQILKSMMPQVAPATWLSSTGILASKSMANELEICSPLLLESLKKSVADETAKKNAVPKF